MADDDVTARRVCTDVEALAAEIDAVVAAMVTSHWPTTPDEFAVWADDVGLFRVAGRPQCASHRTRRDDTPDPNPHRASHRTCGEGPPDAAAPPRATAAAPTSAEAASHPLGEPVLELDEWAPRATHFHATGHPWLLGWRFRDDEFVGVSLFPGADLEPTELGDLGAALRDHFDARWRAEESLHDVPPLTGFTSFWMPGVCMVDLYWHAPRVDPFGDTSRGTVQLAVTHHARARAEDDEAAAHSARRG